MAMILITHDIGVVASCATRVAVMYAGRIAEYGSAHELLVEPQHPYTRGLIGSVPRFDDEVGARFRGLPGAPPDLNSLLPGCAFAPRCASEIATCRTNRPELEPVGTGGRKVACPVAAGNITHGAAP